ncbi:lysine N(6)-hydroxylase/L-ornithine N(5)-oxygenase family protein [Parafrankia sp. BMG5.11]|uniref:lysine N(6)-hydroxylase/L-ornithine N(5)-oxygenase family protein n=1 Tax=Parafrankia sp. BMG5.11 TaxID=222540 RepID=UPI00103EF6B2|nr:SidA/IucD/PvdA family monooxygenase [Parafrankia sp. BMG5.11]TCJ30699.1 L-lysine 6-monooxygenase [Parafrankia sp. BMG5.11]
MNEVNTRSDAVGMLPDVVDIIGIGFGPANLSLAIAIEERNGARPAADRVTARFVEAQPRFGWHDGMLLPGTTMQISFLKDLATMRSPTSSYSFLNYLHERGRLSDFINLKSFFPTRLEFRDYLAWAAARVNVPVSYGARATRVDHDGAAFTVMVSGGGGGREAVRARSVVVATGLRPVLPDGIEAGPRVFHNHGLLSSLDRLPSTPHGRFLVVGAGQSAAEVAAYLHDTYPAAEVHASIRSFGYVPSDNTPYANRIFDPASVGEYYTAPPDVKQQLLRRHWSTNYAAVDAELIDDLYRREYDEKLRGVRRLFVHRVTEVESLREGPGGVVVALRDLGARARTPLEVDAVVFATGFRPSDPRGLLGDGIDLEAALDGDESLVARDYSLRVPGLEGRIFLSGGVQHSHGLSSSLLSTLAVRAGEILEAAVPTHRSHMATGS